MRCFVDRSPLCVAAGAPEFSQRPPSKEPGQLKPAVAVVGRSQAETGNVACLNGSDSTKLSVRQPHSRICGWNRRGVPKSRKTIILCPLNNGTSTFRRPYLKTWSCRQTQTIIGRSGFSIHPSIHPSCSPPLVRESPILISVFATPPLRLLIRRSWFPFQLLTLLRGAHHAIPLLAF